MLITVDPTSAAPLFDQIATAVRLAVVRGEVSAGERLPSARELADSLDLNVHTVLHAYRTLREEGLLEVRRGRGATISASAGRDYQDLRTALDTLVAESDRLGLTRQALVGLLTHEETR
ncbi:GntR family transcriptional regulator [Occultella gossypii]|uniref:GntR family transcriptional regulator n=1 Tax=Occultella gossypii TaxID=2800820 RepID=A0ABS7S730_9MICO|nr:GntR family transcriptional regulator [Occultella gossypii]MBZ2196156.1 GntR family transcriptional regulator [Occultella gossypii]